ncbi:MAG: periplasmic thioredoxin of cytochrome c-type biogenesis [Psychromonas sp.]
MINNKSLEQIKDSLANGETCVVNLTAIWCSDCTDQAQNLALFNEMLATNNVPCYTLVMQQEKNIYLSSEHQTFTEKMGGHGFPRTLLVIKGKVVDADNVEVISEKQLNVLSEKFIGQL